MKFTIDNIITGNWHKGPYKYGVYISYLLFFIAFTGIIAISPSYLNTLEQIIKYYISIFLIIRFNPWVSKKIKYTPEKGEFDRDIAFSAGVFLLLTTGFVDAVKGYTNQLISLAH